MDISLRLRAIAAEVRYRTLADIGTDHGYLPVYLAASGRIDRAAACDIKKGPLARAKATIDKYGFGDIIDLRLGGGFSRILPGEFQTAVIAGMGGMLTIEIITAAMACAKSFQQLVLQPQLDVVAVRKFLHSAGFKIDNETMVLDEPKYYNILSCSPGDDEPYDDNDYLFGKILLRKKDAVLKSAVVHKLAETEKILTRMTKAKHKNKAALLRQSALTAAVENYRGVLTWL